MRPSKMEEREAKETKEVEEAKDKTVLVHLPLDDLSAPQPPSTLRRPIIPFLRRKILAMRLAASLTLLGLVMAFSSLGTAQNNPQAKKPSETAKSQDSVPPLSHDLSGVWMQYRDGDVPGTPGMNGVN